MERLINFDPQWINDVVITGINIFILFFAMSYLLFTPARDYLEKRRKKIAGDLENLSVLDINETTPGMRFDLVMQADQLMMFRMRADFLCEPDRICQSRSECF